MIAPSKSTISVTAGRGGSSQLANAGPSCSDPYSGRYRSGRSRGSGTRRNRVCTQAMIRAAGPRSPPRNNSPESPAPQVTPEAFASFETGEQQRAARVIGVSRHGSTCSQGPCAQSPPSAEPLSSRARTWTPETRQLHRASRDSGQAWSAAAPRGQQSIPLSSRRRCSSARAPVCDQARPQALLTDSPGVRRGCRPCASPR